MTTKVALITGGSSGIGLDVTRSLAERGNWEIHILGRKETQLAQAIRDFPDAIAHEADVCEYKGLAAAFQETFLSRGHIDFVFANAGVLEKPTFYETHNVESDSPPPELDLTTLEVDLKGVAYTAYLALHYFRLSPHRGKDTNLIINSSCAGIYPAFYAPLYSAAKHGVIGFMRSIAPGFQLEGIRVNGICSSIVKTNLVEPGTWNSFPDDRFVPVELISSTILRILNCDNEKDQEIADSKGVHVARSQLYGCAIEISGTRLYFNDHPEFCDRNMRELMEKSVLAV